MRWTPGQSGNPNGMKPGTRRKVPAEVRALAQHLFDASYWQLKHERIHAGTEHPKIEETLLAYAYGAPPKEIIASGTVVHLGPLEALRTVDVTADTIPVPVALVAAQQQKGREPQ